MTSTIIGYEGGLVSLVAVLLALAIGLAAALLAAIRRDTATGRTSTVHRPTGHPSLARSERQR